MVKKALIYVTGLLFMAFGVAFSVNSSLGVSPVNSLPYVISRITGLDLGNCVIGIFAFYILVQILLLRKKFRPIDLTQLVFSTIFGRFVDVAKKVVGDFAIPTYPGQLDYAGDQYRFCSNRRMPVYGCAAGKHAHGRNDSCSKPCILPGQAFS